jgi:hypothetical protein
VSFAAFAIFVVASQARDKRSLTRSLLLQATRNKSPS